MTLESVLVDMENHCNNYFNSGNDKTDPTRNHPPEFLNLAELIFEFRQEHKPSNIVSESEIVAGSDSWSVKAGTTANGAPIGWQQVFSADLSVYKRARFI